MVGRSLTSPWAALGWSVETRPLRAVLLIGDCERATTVSVRVAGASHRRGPAAWPVDKDQMEVGKRWHES
jgi:hypothetical protein